MDYFSQKMYKLPNSRKTALKLLVITGVVVLFVGLFYPFFTVNSTAEVIEVIDGDTIKVEQSDRVRTVRLKDVDTPETSGYNSPEEFKQVPSRNWKCLEDWGYKAKDFVDREIGEQVVIEYRKGVLTVERGSFGRLLADIRLKQGNETLSQVLIENGYARAYGEEHLQLEEKARNESKGLWRECTE